MYLSKKWRQFPFNANTSHNYVVWPRTGNWGAAIYDWQLSVRIDAIGQERGCARRCDNQAWSLSHGNVQNVGQKFSISLLCLLKFNKLRCSECWSGGLSSKVQRFGILNTTKVTQIYPYYARSVSTRKLYYWRGIYRKKRFLSSLLINQTFLSTAY